MHGVVQRTKVRRKVPALERAFWIPAGWLRSQEINSITKEGVWREAMDWEGQRRGLRIQTPEPPMGGRLQIGARDEG